MRPTTLRRALPLRQPLTRPSDLDPTRTTEPVSSDILTPSFKVKRQALKETYHAQLEQAYRESDEAPVGVKARL